MCQNCILLVKYLQASQPLVTKMYIIFDSQVFRNRDSFGSIWIPCQQRRNFRLSNVLYVNSLHLGIKLWPAELALASRLKGVDLKKPIVTHTQSDLQETMPWLITR